MVGASRKCKASAVTSHIAGLAVRVGTIGLGGVGAAIAVSVVTLGPMRAGIGSVSVLLQARAGIISKRNNNLFICQASQL